MDSSYTTGRYQINCPKPEVIEKILLRAYKHPLLMQVFEEHIASCNKCREIVEHVRIYYEILDAELQKPVSMKVIQFAKSISSGNPKSKKQSPPT